MSRFVVVGAGIAGLSIAVRLSAAHDVLVLEREYFPGGKIHTQHIDGFTFEWGPNGFLSSATDLATLVREVGLESSLTEANPAAATRYIYYGGALHKLPSKPTEVLKLSLLSTRGKMRALGELFVGGPTGDDATREESVYRFFERRFGEEVAERIVAPALLGITGGDARRTSVEALFPRLREMESEHQSVIRAMMSGGSKPGRITGFGAEGMQKLVDTLAGKLGARLRTDSAVKRIDPLSQGWLITYDGGETYADGLIITTPADVTANLIAHFDPELAKLLRTIPYAPMRAIGIAYRQEDVPGKLDAFGFLAARDQGVRILGALYTSTIFPEQAPPGTAYLRVFVGGAGDPESIALDSAEVRTIVRDDLAKTLDITAQPIAYHEAIWPRAIPQYTLDHRSTMRKVNKLVSKYGALSLAGNAYRGLGLGDNVKDALKVAAAMTDTSKREPNVA
jgi:oxygen-dependent protoporphyrinogen oxidase